MIRVIHPSSGSRISILTFYPSRIQDPGVKKAPDPGSATLERTVERWWFWYRQRIDRHPLHIQTLARMEVIKGVFVLPYTGTVNTVQYGICNLENIATNRKILSDIL
jgi:hypothetical protein